MRPQERAQAVFEAGVRRLSGQDARPYPVPTRSGQAQHIERMEYGQREGVTYVNVWLAGDSTEPSYRLINPPLLVRDPAGPVTHGGHRYREDPMAAVAQVVARHRDRTAKRRTR